MYDFKKGFAALSIYFITILMAFYMSSWVQGLGKNIVYAIFFIIVLVIWYEAINSSFKVSLSTGLFTMGFFIIPSLLISYFTYPAFLGARESVHIMIYNIFHGPFIFTFYSIMNFSNHFFLTFVFPSIIIITLSIYPLIKNISGTSGRQRNQYIIR